MRKALELINLFVGAGLGITSIVTFSVAASNGGFVDVDSTGADNATLATIHHVVDVLTEELSGLDIDVTTMHIGCALAELECPHTISGVAVTSIVTGILSVLSILLALWFRYERRHKNVRRGRRRLHDDGL